MEPVFTFCKDKLEHLISYIFISFDRVPLPRKLSILEQDVYYHLSMYMNYKVSLVYGAPSEDGLMRPKYVGRSYQHVLNTRQINGMYLHCNLHHVLEFISLFEP
jgi:hypothetical protein